MSIELAKAYLKQFGRDKDVLEFAESSATVELAARAVGVIPARIAKTLSFLLKDGTCVLILAAGDAKIDNAKYKQQFATKAKMLTPEEVVSYTGHEIGGVCPFGADRTRVRVYLDESLRRFHTVFPAAGSGNSAIAFSPDELFSVSQADAWIDVCKGWQENEDLSAR